ncbi:cation:proton antiporter [Mycolicibacterium bacteremicum]|uniref:Sodium:proton exchanger n=1 Tax=Mycolicibacterium bacteremicum TaxID=564198 RepID=A0A1W9YW88_MYCBA|nr:cation:proton antiporter [Mycolicibacterium bacteremicum]MCV7430502.1 cation:proton antiporter [Mycolicibacterium bacteremicum]ORA04202.1 sodium:proton exchanger [Mycolicibacterium bacteremicum]
MLLSFVIVSGVLAAWALSARRLRQWRITAPLFLVVAGALVEYFTHGSLADTLNSETAQHAAEIILAVLLFVDANAIRDGMFGAHPRAATRLLFVALPLSMGLAVLLGAWLLPGLSLATLVVVACIVVPIDFAPAPSIVRDRLIPSRVRDLLNVEAGYSDGIISPIFVFALIVADVEADAGTAWEAVGDAFPHTAKAIVVGLCVGGGLALAANAAQRRGLMTGQSARILTVATPALAYTLSLGVHANGFVAAFLCGIGYHYFRRTEDAERDLELIEDVSFLLTALMWFVFGGVLLIAYWRSGLTAGVVVFCVLALTLVRMLPVAVAMIGSQFSWPERLLLGWLGPRGAAAIVLGLLAFNVLDDPDEHIVLLTMVVMVLGSVLLHGFGAPVAARAFARTRSE